MKDRTTITIGPRQKPTNERTVTPTLGHLPVAPPVQQDEFLRRARIEAAQAAVNATSHRLANTYLPYAERWELAREHEYNVRHLARVRTENGAATLADIRILHPEAATAIEARFWADDISFRSADDRLKADVADAAVQIAAHYAGLAAV